MCDHRSRRVSAAWVRRAGSKISWLWRGGGSGETAFVEGDDFIESLVELRGITRGGGDTVADMIFQQLGLESSQGGVDGGDRVKDLGAFPVVFNHPPDPFDLPGDLFHTG